MKKILLICLLMLSMVSAFAQDPADVNITLEGYIVTTETNADGDLVEVFEAATEAQPGDLVEYRVLLSNTSDSPLTNAAATGPVPASTVFLADSATQTATYLTEFSVDGGDSYAQTPVILVTNEDGSQEEVTASPEDYSTVRWTLMEPLQPQASHSFSYRVTVR